MIAGQPVIKAADALLHRDTRTPLRRLGKPRGIGDVIALIGGAPIFKMYADRFALQPFDLIDDLDQTARIAGTAADVVGITRQATDMSLRELHGVGPKTVACVLLFSLGMPAMPVDTHVFRVARRLALIPERAGNAAMTAEKAHGLLESIVPADDFYAFHIGLIKHGRRTCTAQRPRCPECVLNGLCPSATKFHPELKRTARARR